MKSLREALRPRSLDEVIGNDSIKPAISKFVEQGCRRWLFYGPTGTGKTSLAWIVARKLYGSDTTDDRDVVEVNGADLRGIEEMRELTGRVTRYHTWGGNCHVIILDEVHQLTNDAKTLLLKPLEDTSTTVWILCTTDVTKLDRALRDRCTQFQLKSMGPAERRQLVERAVKYLGYTGDTARFLKAIDQSEAFSARDILGAFERFVNGMPVEEAVGV